MIAAIEAASSSADINPSSNWVLAYPSAPAGRRRRRAPDQPGDDHHWQPVGDGVHPLDAAVVNACCPEFFEDLGDQRLERAHPFRGELRQQQLAVRGVHRVVGRDQDVGAPADLVHRERRHPPSAV